MPRRLRLATGGQVYHVLNRRVGRLKLFARPADYAEFEKILAEAYYRTGTRIAVYSLLPTHWHLLLWPRRDDELSEVLRWITVTHTQRWHVRHRTSGTGPVYQGRFKSFPVQANEHFLTVARYVERNALRATLVSRAEDWQWSSLWRRVKGDPKLNAWLSEWPVEQPRNWVKQVNQRETVDELEKVRLSVNRGKPYGNEAWVLRTAKRCGLESTLRPPGRPKRS